MDGLPAFINKQPNVEISTVLPEIAAMNLVEASKQPKALRIAEIDRVTAEIKKFYPQMFHKED